MQLKDMKKQEIIEKIAINLADKNEPGGYKRFPIHNIIEAEKRMNNRFTCCKANYITATRDAVGTRLLYHMDNGSVVQWRATNLTKDDLLKILNATAEAKLKRIFDDGQKVHIVTVSDVCDFVEENRIPVVTTDIDKAIHVFKSEVEKAKSTAKEFGWVEEDYDETYCYSCYDDGRYAENHVTVSLITKNLE